MWHSWHTYIREKIERYLLLNLICLDILILVWRILSEKIMREFIVTLYFVGLTGIIIFKIIRGIYKMSQGNLVDKLLKMDVAPVTELPTGEIEIKRWSKIVGEPFKVKCQAINGARYNEIMQLSVEYDKKKGGLKDIDTSKSKMLTVVEGIITPDLKKKELMNKFGVVTPKGLVYKMFLPGEIDRIYELITSLCGYDETDDAEAVEDEIKN